MLRNALGLTRPGVTACVGAGGKTSLLRSLAADEQSKPVVITSTTKMGYRQVLHYPLVVNENYDTGLAAVIHELAEHQCAAWFAGRVNEKIIGVSPDWVDNLAAVAPNAYILVEADGARRCLIKAPAAWEPVIPGCTTMTVGILNIRAMGQPLSPDNAHRLELVTGIIHQQPGAIITWQDIARLAVHPQGLFQYARGTKVLVLSGNEDPAARMAVKQIAGYVKAAQTGIERVVATRGYGDAVQVTEVFVL